MTRQAIQESPDMRKILEDLASAVRTAEERTAAPAVIDVATVIDAT